MESDETVLIVKIEASGKLDETFLRKALKPETKIGNLRRKVEEKLPDFTRSEYKIGYIDSDGNEETIDDIDETDELPLSDFCPNEKILYIEPRSLGSDVKVRVTNKTLKAIPVVKGKTSRWEYLIIKPNVELGFGLEKEFSLKVGNAKGMIAKYLV